MATPFASGLAALYLSQQAVDSTLPPVRSTADLMTRFKDVAVDKGPVGRDAGWGWGVVDTTKLFARPATPDKPPTNPPADPPAAPPEDPDTEVGEEHDLLWGVIRGRAARIGNQEGFFIYVPT